MDELEEESENDIWKELAKGIATIEYFYKVKIDSKYPVLKRLNQMEYLSYMLELDAKRNGLIK